MPAVLTAVDQIDNAQFVRSNDGWSYTRQFLVTGLDAFPASSKMFQAAEPSNYAAGLMPSYGSLHPAAGLAGMRVDNVTVSPVQGSANQATIVFTYSYESGKNNPPSETATPTTEFGSTVANITQYVDNNNTDLVISNFTIGGNTQPSQWVQAETTISCPYVMFERREPRPFNKSKVTTYVNSVNSQNWFGDAQRTWKCTAIRATLKGDAFAVRYEFQFKADKWDQQFVYTDPSTRAPYIGATYANGGRILKALLPERDFNLLNLGV